MRELCKLIFSLATDFNTSKRLHLGCVLSILLCLLNGGCSSKEEKGTAPPVKAVPVKLMKIQASNVSSTVTLVGSMDSRNSVDLFTRIDGYISKIPIVPGMLVKPGQLLIRVDSNKQDAQVAAKRSSVELARADLAKEVGKLGSLEADKEARQSTVDFNNLEYQRYYWLEKRGVVATATVDKEDRDLRVAKARLASLDAEIAAQKEVIERSKQRIEEAKAELQAEKAELAYHTMNAPFSGVIGDVPVKVGDYVNPQTKLTKISKTKPLEVNIQVPQDQAKFVTNGTRMEILGDDGTSYGETTAFYVSPTVSPENQSVLVKGMFANNNNQLRPDQSVQVKLILKNQLAVSVPTEAISFIAGKAFIFVKEVNADGKVVARQRPIEISTIENNTATIKSGLKSGEEIVVSGIQLLADKTPIDESGGS